MFDLTTLDIFMNLSIAVVLGLALGSERSIAGKVAGMRTFALVSLSAALFVTTAILITDAYIGRVNFDPMRIPAAIITGIGFLGAGMIMFRDSVLRGLTTAAGLWVAAGVGSAVAFGLYSVAISATLLTLFVFTVVWFAEDKLKAMHSNNSPTIVDGKLTKEEEIDE